MHQAFFYELSDISLTTLVWEVSIIILPLLYKKS